MKKYLIFDLDGTLIQSSNQISEIIYKYIAENIDPELLDTARYIIESNQWISLKEWFTILLDWDKESANFHSNIIYTKINNIKDNIIYFEWIVEKIHKLSNKYRLFLSTWNSDIFANDILKKWWILSCFDKVLWSSNILKSPLHIDEFINCTWDENFCDKAIFIWDGQRDQEIAEAMNIEFIHISNTWKNKYEIQSVVDIDSILDEINN